MVYIDRYPKDYRPRPFILAPLGELGCFRRLCLPSLRDEEAREPGTVHPKFTPENRGKALFLFFR